MALETPIPNTRPIDYAALVRQAWGDEWNKPDTAYKFSNAREFKDPGENGGAYDLG